jgi:PAS domain S-box-containing protein
MPDAPPSTDAAGLGWNDLQALVEQVEDYAMFVLDLRGHVASWNRGAEKIKLYTPQQIIGQHFSKFYPREDIESGKPARELEIALAEGHVTDEGWRIRADGSRFWAFVSITLLRDAKGRPRGFAKVTRDLTERRNAQEALRRSEERFRLLIEDVSDYAIYMLDAQGVIATWNTGAQKIKGYRAQEIIGKHFEIFFTPEARAAGHPMAELEKARIEGRFAEEGWRLRADGSQFWASVVVTALRDATGELIGFSKITRDLTGNKVAEDIARELQRQHTARAVAEAGELRAREERERFRLLNQQLNVILEGVVDGITVQDRRGKLIFANSAAARLSGLSSREEMMGMDAGELIKRFEMLDEHGNLFSPANLPGRRVLGGEAQASALIHVRNRQTGQSWWSQIRANAVLGDDGRPEMAINIWHDVSHQRRQEEHERYLNQATEALSKSLDYQATLDTLADMLVPGLCDWCAIHLVVGDALRGVTVAHADPRKKKLAQQYLEKYPPNPEEESGLWQVIRSGRPTLHEHVPEEALVRSARDAEHLELLRAAGMRSLILVPIKVRDQVSGTLSLIAAESGRRYDARDLALAAELGRRVGTFIENAQLYERAQQAASRAALAAREAEAAGRMKDEFLATVSHELRTPLNAILGWSSMLKVRKDPASLAKGVDVIHRNALAQSKIIEDILDVSRIITGKLRLELGPVDLAMVICDALEVVRPSAAAREISLRFDKPAESKILAGDAERLQQVMWNLLSNAVKFSEPGGEILVEVEQRGSQLAVTVTDHGKGIDPEFLPYVFDRFKQADSSTTRRFGGLGLGLAIVRHIVELHGGRASVRSNGLGQGASFEVVLPIHATVPLPAEAKAASPREPLLAAQAPSLVGLRVLVVDDEVDARELLELVLTQIGATVRSVGTASSALTVLEDFHPDVIVSDIGMPDEDGYGFMRRVRALPGAVAQTPAIALTAYTRSEDRLKALAMGFSVHLGKPVNPDDLIALISVLAKPQPR